jgi:hypothetical protein
LKTKKSVKKNPARTNPFRNFSTGIYFGAGLIVAAILFIVISRINNDEELSNGNQIHVWSPETDSLFVRECYDKYKPQVKDDLNKQQNMMGFCRCMLAKIKTKYDEDEMGRIADSDIKQWDSECREEMLNPNHLKMK